MSSLREEFLLESEVTFLNHGSFGATPRPVFDVYQRWQRRLEAQPVRFFATELTDRLGEARHALAAFLNVGGDDLVYIPNATFGANLVARSLALQPGDEILTCDHEYGACSNAWQFVAQRSGARYVRQPLDLPVSSPDAVADALWAGVTSRTKVIYLSHITSPTAITLPIAEICRRARVAGVLTVIDGAHAPGQLDLDLAAIDADFYFGNCHKWLLSPKGAAFLHVRPDRQSLIQPLVVGWGWGPERNLDFGSDFLNATQFLGTNDLSAYLSVPAALAFRNEHHWSAQQARCQALVDDFLTRMATLTGLPRIYPPACGFYRQLGAAPLPPTVDPVELKRALLEEYNIEIPISHWRDARLLRISIQAYNDQRDVDRLMDALAALL